MAKRFERAIEALLSTRTTVEASQISGIPLRTLRRWECEDVDFQRAFARAKERLLSRAVAILARDSAAAATALSKIATGRGRPHDTSKTSACVNVIKLAMEGVGYEVLEERIRRLEEARRQDVETTQS